MGKDVIKRMRRSRPSLRCRFLLEENWLRQEMDAKKNSLMMMDSAGMNEKAKTFW